MSILSRFLAVLALLCLVTTGHAADPLRLRVLSYNIHHAKGVDGTLDLQRIANVWKAMGQRQQPAVADDSRRRPDAAD